VKQKTQKNELYPVVNHEESKISPSNIFFPKFPHYLEGEDEDDTENGGENTHETENVDQGEIKGFNYRESKN